VPIDYFKRAGRSKFHPLRDAYNYIIQVLRMVMYFNPLRVLMPVGLTLLAATFRQGRGRPGRPPLACGRLDVLVGLAGFNIMAYRPARRPGRPADRPPTDGDPPAAGSRGPSGW
jgi:hypothetical protein